MPTQSRLKELFDYDDATGALVWKISKSTSTRAGMVAGSPHPDGYLSTRIDRRGYYNHRLVYTWHYGTCPAQLDHIDGDRTNNKLSNLRPASKSQNQANKKKSVGNSQWKGVHKPKGGNTWRAGITIDHKRIHLGMFETEADAAMAYNIAALEAFGDFAVQNRHPDNRK